MKPIAVAACLLFSASLLQAEATPTTPKTPDMKAPAAKDTVAPAKDALIPAKTVVPPKQPVKKEEELPKIPGTTITRPDGNLLGLEVVGGVFKLSFYDKKHKAMAVDVTRATARWPNPKAPGDNRTVLNISGTALVGQKPVVPPFTFNVFLTLLQGEGEEAKAVENYTVAFKG